MKPPTMAHATEVQAECNTHQHIIHDNEIVTSAGEQQTKSNHPLDTFQWRQWNHS